MQSQESNVDVEPRTGTQLIALKVFKDTGGGTFGYLEQALQWVLANRVQYGIGVINLSLGDSDIDGNGALNAIDTALLTLRTRAAGTPVVPAVPVLPLAPAVSPPAPSQAPLAGTIDQIMPAGLTAAGAKKVNLNSTAVAFAIKRITTVTAPVLPSASTLSALRVSLNASSVGASFGQRKI